MFERYALFYTPTGALARIGASWLGWDSAAGCPVPHPQVATVDCAALTATPRRYGFHGTLKAPFHLADDMDLAGLQEAAAGFARHQKTVSAGSLHLSYAKGFVALRPVQDTVVLCEFAAKTVRTFDAFRAPMTPEEIAARRRARLSPRQETQMASWGYPYIFDDFHFHLTLTGRLPAKEADAVITVLAPLLKPVTPQPLMIDAITLMGADSAGMFHQITRFNTQ